ncbi:hypothetical protein ACIP98_41775 [Streptomyces sp. NPDC088354]|uniref:hypothetical protein n=1 Tax=unclassified Streptomyces TaxID=2593676 RepID=UPI0029B743DA|nr:hypothetical protein [Streptomyces sp. MI02-7b]MDX3076717.1 hypothetical protein [Streptomyces sp. MI02-7b]
MVQTTSYSMVHSDEYADSSICHRHRLPPGRRPGSLEWRWSPTRSTPLVGRARPSPSGLAALDSGDGVYDDWAHAETRELTEIVWPFRALDFLQGGITPPRCEGHQGFWDRFTFATDTPPMFYADSNLHADRLTPAHYALPASATAAWQEVHLFDAHHDAGYPHQDGPRTLQEWNARGQFSREDWMLVHYARGTRLTLTYPAWRPAGERTPPMVPRTSASTTTPRSPRPSRNVRDSPAPPVIPAGSAGSVTPGRMAGARLPSG